MDLHEKPLPVMPDELKRYFETPPVTPPPTKESDGYS